MTKTKIDAELRGNPQPVAPRDARRFGFLPAERGLELAAQEAQPNQLVVVEGHVVRAPTARQGEVFVRQLERIFVGRLQSHGFPFPAHEVLVEPSAWGGAT